MSEWPSGAPAYVQAIADTKLILGQRYAQWSLAGPTLEDNMGGASAAQEEIGHVRQFNRLLSQQGRDERWLEGDRSPQEFANAASLDDVGDSWVSFTSAVAPTDRATWYLIDAIDHEAFGGMVTKMGEDEYFHLEYHDATLETLAADEPRALQSALEATLPDVLAFIGPATDDAEADSLYRSGFTDRPIAELREAFRDHYQALFAQTDVSLTDVDWDVPDPEAWDETRRRVGDGSITDADVAQLSGERNAEFTPPTRS